MQLVSQFPYELLFNLLGNAVALGQYIDVIPLITFLYGCSFWIDASFFMLYFPFVNVVNLTCQLIF